MNLYYTISGFKTFNNVLFVINIATFFIPFKQKYTFLRLMLRKSKKESLVAGNHYSIKTTSKGNRTNRHFENQVGTSKLIMLIGVK